MMKRETGFKWLFLDLNSYFASVEQQERPELRGKPVAVTPMQTEHTCAIAASYEAKAYGVKTGTIIRDARRMCPHLRCVLARHDLYVAYHHKIIEEVINHTPVNKICSIDELSSRIPPSKRNIDAAQHIAHSIKSGIWQNVGEAINCSIGFAPNSLLAKIACEMKKPNGLTILSQEELPGPLLDLQLTDLPGIGVNMAKRLRRSGVHNMLDLWNLSPKHARKIWGSVQGERFWYQLHGYDVEPQETSTSMVGHSRVLDPSLRSPDKARLILRKLTMKAATRLKSKGFFAHKINVSLRTTCREKRKMSLSLHATQDAFQFLECVDELWAALLCSLDNSHARIKTVSVIFHDLTVENMITDDLFMAQSGSTQSFQNNALSDAIESLQRRYQHDVVSLGLPPKTSSGYVGTKIAFSRVPDQSEFWS